MPTNEAQAVFLVCSYIYPKHYIEETTNVKNCSAPTITYRPFTPVGINKKYTTQPQEVENYEDVKSNKNQHVLLYKLTTRNTRQKAAHIID